MKRLAFLLLLPLATACGEPAPPPRKAPVAVNPGPPAPPDTLPPTYVGRWAARPDLCASGAWVFTDKTLTTAGEVSCTFTQITPNETGWIAEGGCIAQAPASPATLVLNTTGAGQTRTLAVSGGPFTAPRVLTSCPVNPADLARPVADAEAQDRRIAAGPANIAMADFTQGSLISQAWREDGQIVKLAEPLLGDVGRKLAERQYYFRPGEPAPYLIRESQASYAVEDGEIAAVFSRDGVELQMPADRDKAELERRLLGRAAQLRQAAEVTVTPGAVAAPSSRLKK